VPDGRTNWSHAPRDESDAIRAVLNTSDALSINEKRSAFNLMGQKNKNPNSPHFSLPWGNVTLYIDKFCVGAKIKTVHCKKMS